MKVVLTGGTVVLRDVKRSIFKVRVVFLDVDSNVVRDGYIGRGHTTVMEIPDGARYVAIVRSVTWNDRVISVFDLRDGKLLGELRSTRIKQIPDLMEFIRSLAQK